MTVLSRKLASLEESDTVTFAETIYELYKGKTVEIYVGEKSGSLYYADYDVEQKVYVTGEPVGAHGQLLLMKCTIDTGMKRHIKEVAVNAWSITGVMVAGKDRIHISRIFQEMKR